ncbi:MAG TPA: AI-2E family transporter [Fimbriimonas sp.]|nr:AI-2E family transporter [Fimbriimonas sp.]
MPGWRILLWAVLVVAALSFIYLVRGILLPFVVSFIIAALLEPTVRKLRLRGISRKAAVFIVMSAFFVVVGGIGVVVAPSISRETSALGDRVQNWTNTLSQSSNDSFFVRWDPVLQAQAETSTSGKIDALLSRYGDTLSRLGLPSTREGIMEQYVRPNTPQITKAVRDFSNSAFGIITGLFSHLVLVIIVPLLVYLILLDMDHFRRHGPRWIPPSIRASAVSILNDIGQVFIKYLRGITTVVLIYGIVMTTFLGITAVPGWILLGPLFAGLYLIPYIGNIISGLIVFSVIGFSDVTGGIVHPFASPWAYATLVTLIYFAIGAVFDHMIYPQMVGNSVGLSPVVSMFVIFCGGALFGLPGMLVAFPLAGSVKVILDRLIRVSVTQDGLRLPSVPLRHRTT